MDKSYYGYRSKSCRSVFVGTAHQIAIAKYGHLLELPLKVTDASFDSVTQTWTEHASPLPSVESRSKSEIGKASILRPRWDVRDYARKFDWGRLTPECMQLAVALLADVFGDAAATEVLKYHEKFARVVLQSLPEQEWSLSEREIAFFVSVDVVE